MHFAIIVREIMVLAFRLNWIDPEKQAGREEFHSAGKAYSRKNNVDILYINSDPLKSFIKLP